MVIQPTQSEALSVGENPTTNKAQAKPSRSLTDAECRFFERSEVKIERCCLRLRIKKTFGFCRVFFVSERFMAPLYFNVRFAAPIINFGWLRAYEDCEDYRILLPLYKYSKQTEYNTILAQEMKTFNFVYF